MRRKSGAQNFAVGTKIPKIIGFIGFIALIGFIELIALIELIGSIVIDIARRKKKNRAE